MIFLKSATAALALTAGLCIVGCSGNSGESSSAPGAPPPVPKLKFDAAPGVVLTVGDTSKITAPDAAMIEAEIRAIDWNDNTARHRIQLARTNKEGTTVVKLQGTLGTPNEDGLLRAIVTSESNDGVVLDTASPSLNNIDAAIELLLLVETDCEKLKNIANSWPK